MYCKKCQQDVTAIAATSGPQAKNPNRPFWKCPSPCGNWINWIDAPTPTVPEVFKKRKTSEPDTLRSSSFAIPNAPIIPRRPSNTPETVLIHKVDRILELLSQLITLQTQGNVYNSPEVSDEDDSDNRLEIRE